MRQPSHSEAAGQSALMAPNQNNTIDQQQQQQQQQLLLANMPSPLDHLEGARRVKSNSGRLFLAAIVHYDSYSSAVAAPPSSESADCDKKAARLSAGEQEASKEGAHEERPAPRRLAKFARLFSLRANRRLDRSHKRKIDGLDDNEKCEAEPERRERSSRGLANDQTIMMDRASLQTCARQASRSSGSETPDSQPAEERKVIEFKFDLIVESERHAESAAGEPPQMGQQAEEILRPIKQRKLLDQVDELVEAFVLDSLDGCLMSAGRRHLTKSLAADQFDYALELAKLTLTHAFQLLRAASEQTRGEKRALNYPGGRPSALRIEAFSIELEATLFEAAGSGHSVAISDLLAADLATPDIAAGAAGTNQKRECHSVEQALGVLQLVRSNLARKTRITGEQGNQNDDNNNSNNNKNDDADMKPNRLLMICLKLKQLINGGSFTNRLCLLDLAEPARSELGAIFAAIFSGQALGHLKREKAHLRTLEVQLDSMRRREERAQGCASGPTLGEHAESSFESRQQHRRIASLTRLIQAEWLIYKQLGAALIKTLVIVHCHRATAAAASNKCGQQPNDLARLMEYNLELLEFARALRKASSSRLRRRRRHLRSHMNSATNLSFVSDTNLSSNWSDEEHPTAYQPAGRPHARHDLMIASPFRLARPVCARRRAAGCLDCLEHQADFQSSQYDLSGARALSTRSRLSHHQGGAHRVRGGARQGHPQRGQNRHQRHRHEQRYGRTTSSAESEQRTLCDDQLSIDTSYRDARASSLSGRRRRSDLTGSSSLASTSSGSQRGRAHAIDTDGPLAAPSPANQLGSHSSQISQLMSQQRRLLQQQRQRARMSSLQQLNQRHGAPSDTEDSVASANLNSCASQPMRASQRSGDLARLLKVMQSGGSREEELRWFQAAAGKFRMARKHSNTLDSASESTSIDSPPIELQSFCAANNNNNTNTNLHNTTPKPQTSQTISLASSGELDTHSHQAADQSQDRLLDTASDICSEVAEPPRQLKLEEFLSQLNSAIAPSRAAAAHGETERCDSLLSNHAKSNAYRPSAGADHDEQEDEDEDCKSHSSILDHLSSLTLESNLRLRLQSTAGAETSQAYLFHANGGLLSEEQPSGRVNIIEDGSSSKPVGGHLQQLLKSTLRMHNKSALARQHQQERIEALSIDCETNGVTCVLLPLDSRSAHAASDLAQTPSTPSSSDSSASGSSSTSTDDQSGRSSGPDLLQQRVPTLAINQLYSGVIRQHT